MEEARTIVGLSLGRALFPLPIAGCAPGVCPSAA